MLKLNRNVVSRFPTYNIKSDTRFKLYFHVQLVILYPRNELASPKQPVSRVKQVIIQLVDQQITANDVQWGPPPLQAPLLQKQIAVVSQESILMKSVALVPWGAQMTMELSVSTAVVVKLEIRY